MIRRPANMFFASLGTLLALLIAAPLGAQPAPAVVRVTDPADLRKALDEGLSSDTPSVVEVRVA